MDLLSLTIFVEIVDSGNLSQAARSLNMSRANVSYHLASLEKSLGAELLRRTPQGNELTSAGEHIYQHARNIVNESGLLKEAVKRDVAELTGKVGLSIPTGYGQLVMGGWLIDFKRRYPGIVLDVTDLEPYLGPCRVIHAIACGPLVTWADNRAAEQSERIVASGRTVYGINTGFGLLAQTRIPHERLAELQTNLIRSHAAGVGPPLPARSSVASRKAEFWRAM